MERNTGLHQVPSAILKQFLSDSKNRNTILFVLKGFRCRPSLTSFTVKLFHISDKNNNMIDLAGNKKYFIEKSIRSIRNPIPSVIVERKKGRGQCR